MPHNLFNTLKEFDLGNGKKGRFYSLPELEKQGVGPISKLPVSIRIVLESVLRNYDGQKIKEDDVRALANWAPTAPRTAEIPFVVARIVLQDFTGVPLLVDLAAMRSTVARLGKNPKLIEPLVPVDLVVDHSVQVDVAGSPDALRENMEIEFQRNRPRYQFLKWGMQAFDTFKVVPPGIGIVHQVNLEYLAKGALEKEGVYYPDTLVGTDSHTTMINGLGVVGWGVGGIEAEAGLLPDAGRRRRAYDRRSARRRHSDRSGAALYRDAAQGEGRRQIRRVFRQRRGVALSDRSRDDRQHGAGIRRDHGLLRR
jgi:aconitate hydratase